MMIPIAIGNDFISENQLNQCYLPAGRQVSVLFVFHLWGF